MLNLEQMLFRFIFALILGGVIGLEREIAGKEAGIRTAMLVSAGASIFAMISLIIPYFAQVSVEQLQNTIPDRVLSNIVVGIGFLGAGIIIKTGEHVRGLTTAALIWATAAVGTLVGLGLIEFASIASITIAFILYSLRKLRISERIRPKEKEDLPY